MVVDISLGLWSWYNFIQSILMIFQLVSLLMIFRQTYNKTWTLFSAFNHYLDKRQWCRASSHVIFIYPPPHNTIKQNQFLQTFTYKKSLSCWVFRYLCYVEGWMKIKNILLSWKNANFPRTYLAASLSSTHGPEGMTDRIYDCYFK